MNKKNKLVILITLVTIIIVVASFVFYNKEKTDELINKNGATKKEEQLQEKAVNLYKLIWKEVSASALWPKRDSHATVVYKNKIWIMGGVDGTKRLISPGNVDYGNAPHFKDVWSSQDGVIWDIATNNAPWKDRRSMQTIVFKDKMWLMGGWGPELGCKNDVWSSEDGAKWKVENISADWPAREGHQVLFFNNKLWVMGGVRYDKRKTYNDIWSSEDGINWTKETAAAGWAPRWDFSATVFQNKMWVIGGMDLTQNMFNDVWSSEDGINWNLVNGSPSFSTRQGFITEYKGNLWAIGRLNDQTNKGVNDVWFSEDGINWKKTKKDPLWTGREDFGGVIFKDKIWILGGMDKNWTWTNDVWQSEFDKTDN